VSAKQVTEPGMSDEAITRGSGKGWDEWAEVLDKWGAADKTHAEIAAHVAGEFGVDGWWAQGVTVGYERMRGRRAVNETADGFSANASKTFPVPIEALYSAFTEDEKRDRWLDRNALGLRTSQQNRSARFDIAESGKILEAWFTEKGPEKSSVALQVNKLESREVMEEVRTEWKANLEKLAKAIVVDLKT
jgi:hypothetical protein